MTGPVTPDVVRETARRVLARDYYDLDNAVHPFPLAAKILRWLRDTVNGLLDLLDEVGLPIPPVLFWILIGAVALGFALWLFWWFPRHRGRGAQGLAQAEAELDDLPSDVRTLLQMSREAAEAGNYVDASRALFRAALVRLEQERGGHLRRGLTNTEYIRTFRAPWVVENLKVFADLINWKWYRARSFDEADYRRCRDAFERLDARLRETA